MHTRAMHNVSFPASVPGIFGQSIQAWCGRRRSTASVIKVCHFKSDEERDTKTAEVVVSPTNLNNASEDFSVVHFVSSATSDTTRNVSSDVFATEAVPVLSDFYNSKLDQCSSVRTEYNLESQRLGHGQANVTVVAACCKTDGKRVAVKIVSHEKLNDLQRADLSREVSIHARLDHPHIVSLHKVFETAQETSLVMDLLEGGEVFELLKAGKLGERRAATLLRQTLLALQYLHEQGLVHRDLKPENLVFADAARSTLQLVDFGFAQYQEEIAARHCGTRHYMAPEVYRKELHDTSSDMWSFGIVAYTFLTGVQPWTSNEETNSKLLAEGKPYYWPALFHALSAGAQDFIKKLLVSNAANRLSASAALAHFWIKQMAEP